jgi:hypothetical protein
MATYQEYHTAARAGARRARKAAGDDRALTANAPAAILSNSLPPAFALVASPDGSVRGPKFVITRG